MPAFLFDLSDFNLFVFLCGFFIIGSIVVVCLLRCFISHETRFKENAIIASVSATISVIYGVLVGLIALYLINTINYASDAVQKEANAAANIYRDSLWLKEPLQGSIREQIREYLTHAINSDWGFMMHEKIPDHRGDLIIETISLQLSKYQVVSPAESTIMPELVSEISRLYDARQLRIQASTLELGPEIWLVILIGTFLTVGINYLFGMNLYIHLFSVTALALTVASMIFLLITLDKPFQGEFVIGPDPLQTVLMHIENRGQEPPAGEKTP